LTVVLNCASKKEASCLLVLEIRKQVPRPQLIFFLLLKRYSPLWTGLPIQSPSVPSGLWSLYDNLLFPLPSNPLQTYHYIFSVVFVFSKIYLRQPTLKSQFMPHKEHNMLPLERTVA